MSDCSNRVLRIKYRLGFIVSDRSCFANQWYAEKTADIKIYERVDSEVYPEPALRIFLKITNYWVDSHSNGFV